MTNQQGEMTRRANHAPSNLTKILWWFSTVIPEIIQDCTSDRHRAKIIGSGVLFTWLYATIAWIYFWSINIVNPFIYVPLGIFIGYGILTIDRLLIASIAKGKKNRITIGFRVVLALFLGGFIAQPIILWMFEKDISGEVSLLQDKKTADKRIALTSIFNTESTALNNRKSEILVETTTRFTAIEVAEKAFLQEIDGTGGSGNYGIAGIARKKKEALERAQQSHDSYQNAHIDELQTINQRLQEIEERINAEVDNFREHKLTAGFLIRVEALQQLFEKDQSGALSRRYYLILAILVLFELIPIIGKLYLPTGSYDLKLQLRDDTEIELANTNTEQEVTLKKLYNLKANETDASMIAELFQNMKKSKKDRIDEMVADWKSNKSGTFDELWAKIKRDVLSKQEG
jgi:hypothetical protein